MITDFISKDIPRENLKTALDVVHAFRECESTEEWMFIPFEAWAKLEQLEEFLEHMVNGKPLKDDTIEYMKEGAE